MRHETNMLFVRVGEAQAAALGDYLRERNILINAAPIVRLVTHLDVSRTAYRRRRPLARLLAR